MAQSGFTNDVAPCRRGLAHSFLRTELASSEQRLGTFRAQNCSGDAGGRDKVAEGRRATPGHS
jgi:hypothetical protein